MSSALTLARHARRDKRMHVIALVQDVRFHLMVTHGLSEAEVREFIALVLAGDRHGTEMWDEAQITRCLAFLETHEKAATARHRKRRAGEVSHA